MRSRFLLVTIAALGFAAACSSAPPESAGTAPEGKATVWLMRDTLSEDLRKTFETEFAKDHPDIELDVQIQEWDGIGEKVTAALASNDAPDVIEVGNTQVAQYAAGGGVKDLTGRVGELEGEDWLPGLAEPGRIGGRQYGVPWYAANRVVMYNKEIFKRAGVTEPPRTRDEWLEVTGKLNKGGDQGIYLPGQMWYALAGFIWDEGGELAVRDGDTWRGALDSPQARAGMAFYKRLQALGKGPKDADEATPPQAEVFAKGKVAQLITVPGGARAVEEANPEMKGKVGFFPIPGKTADRPGTVFIGGSDLIIPEASRNQAAGYEVVKYLAGEEFQTEMAKVMKFVPNRASLGHVLGDDDGAAAMAEAAKTGRATPNSPEWAAVEATRVIQQYMTAVLTGKDPRAEAEKATADMTRTLRGGS